MDTLIRDLRFALRTMRQRKILTAAAVVCLALGIGATTAVYSLVDGVLLRPLPYKDPDALYAIWNRFPQQGIQRSLLSGQELLDLAEQSERFETVAGLIPWYFNLTEGEDPERLVGARVSAETFQMLGVQAQIGRAFDADEAERGAAVAMLSHRLWQQRFSGDPDILGRTIKLDEKPYTVIGVMDEHFRYLLGNTDVWVPLVVNPRIPRNLRGVQVVGRLKPGATQQQAEAEMDAISQRFTESFPNVYAPGSGYGLGLFPLYNEIVGGVRTSLLALLGAVTLVLFIGCTNVANLLLAQATTREREISVRAAMGAGRGALVRQMLTESVFLAVLGGGLGVLLARWGLDLIKTMQSGVMPRLHGVTIDLRVLLFALVVSILTGIIFGLVPAFRGSRANLFAVLKEGGKTSADSKSHPVRNALVVVQIALALVVLIGAGLMIRSFQHLQKVDPGFRTSEILTVQMYLGRHTYPTPPQRAAFADQLLSRLRQIPGVQSAGLVCHVPLSSLDMQGEVEVERRETLASEAKPKVGWRFISDGYLETMGIPLMQGRTFSNLDLAESASVALVDATLAERLWPGESPLEKRIKLVGGFGGDVWRTVVGVVGGIKHSGIAAASSEIVYVPYQQAPAAVLGAAIRTDGDPMRLAPAVRAAVREIDPIQPLAKIKTTTQLVEESLTQPRFNRLLFGLFGGVALILSAIGVYGVMAYAVAQRRREIGLRMALGAQPSDNMKLVMIQGMKLAAVGIAVGLFAAWGLSKVLGRFMGGLVHGVAVTDVATFVGVPLVLALLTLVATLLPAFRASRVDPMTSLRDD